MLRLSLIILTILILFSCKKEKFITSTDAIISVSADTLSFDTVFTTVGSITQSFKIRNDNDQKLLISEIKLMGAQSSYYQLNIDGRAINSLSDIELASNDSLYVFVKVSIDPNIETLPFIVRDSIRINYNGNTKWVQLQAYGQNARFLKNQKITNNTTWDNQLPYVILQGCTIDTFATLTIEKGARIFCHADAPFIIRGSLKTNGDKDNKISFQGDRLDGDYKDLPASWPGIFFTTTSHDNIFNFTTIKNAYQAIVIGGSINNLNPQLTLNECIIDNAYDVGLFAFNSSVQSRNCLFSNCGNDAVEGEAGSNILIKGGGNYIFNHATVTTYSNLFNVHKQPVVYISNAGNTIPSGLDVQFKNSIIYGESGLVEDEIKTSKQANSVFSVTLQNVLYKAKTTPANTTILNCITNQDPLFDSINTSRHFYNFHLKSNSPALNKGVASTVAYDLDGSSRLINGLPDLGCYERQ